MLRCPEALSSIQPYLERAAELRGYSALASHELRLMAMTVGSIKVVNKESSEFLVILMDTLEEERNILAPTAESSLAALRALATDLIDRARHSDGDGGNSIRVARAFHAAAVVLDAMRQYGPLDDSLGEAQRYAVARSRQIAKALDDPLPCIPLDWKPCDEKRLRTRLPTQSTAAAAEKQPEPSPAVVSLATSPAQPPSAPPSAPPAQPPLPAGWESRVDGASGRRFYVNLKQRTTSWTLPTADAAAEEEQEEEARQQEEEARQQEEEARQADAAALLLAPESEPPLPHSWESRVDVTTGRRFYVNLAQRTTSWTLPSLRVPQFVGGGSLPPASSALGRGTAAPEAEAMPEVMPEAMPHAIPEVDAEAVPEAEAEAGGESTQLRPHALEEMGGLEAELPSLPEEVTTPSARARTLVEADAVEEESAAEVAASRSNMAAFEAIWARMSVPLGDRRRQHTASGAGEQAPPRDAGGGEGAAAMAAAHLTPPPEGASREEVKKYRAALRKIAVANVSKVQADAASALADFKRATKQQ